MSLTTLKDVMLRLLEVSLIMMRKCSTLVITLLFKKKTCIKGSNGHLSNEQALELLNHKPCFMDSICLYLPSSNNNCLILYRNYFMTMLMELVIIVASRFEESAVCIISLVSKILN